MVARDVHRAGVFVAHGMSAWGSTTSTSTPPRAGGPHVTDGNVHADQISNRPRPTDTLDDSKYCQSGHER